MLRSLLDRRVRRERRYRSDVSLVTEVIAAMISARAAGAPIPPEQLPVAVGLVNLHADVLGAMPLTAGRQTPQIVTRPNPDEPYAATIHKLVQSAMWNGFAAVLVDRPTRPQSASVLDPNAVTVLPDTVDRTRVAEIRVNGATVDRRLVRLFNINVDPRRGPLGRSPFTTAAEPLRMYGFAYAYLADFFEGGGNPSTVLKRTGPGNTVYDPEQAATDWISARQERRPAVLPHGWDLSVPHNNGEMEAVARVLEQSAAEVCRLLNAPPSLANARNNSSMTYSNVAGELARWLALQLVPTWVNRIEDLFSDLAGVRVEADTSTLFRIVDPFITAAAHEANIAPIPNMVTA